MNANQIQNALYHEYCKSSKLIVPNVYVYHKYESDLLRVTKAMYTIEYEIKLTKSDFCADFRKSHNTIVGIKNRRMVYDKQTKHDYYLSGKGPNEFYYVFPQGLIDLQNVPDWCGVIEVKEYDYFGQTRLSLHKVQHPHRLHKDVINTHHLNHLYESTYYRYWSLKSSI